MSYATDNLLPGEKVMYEARLHWIIFSWPLVLVVIGLVMLIGGRAMAVVGGLFILLGAGMGLVAATKYWSSEFAVTDKRVLIKVGWISRRSLETLLAKVEGIGVEQGLSERMLNYGTIVVTGTGGTHERFNGIAAPLAFRQQVQAQIAATEARVERRPSAPAIAAAGREERECPYCAEIILAKAKVCKHCGRDLQPT